MAGEQGIPHKSIESALVGKTVQAVIGSTAEGDTRSNAAIGIGVVVWFTDGTRLIIGGSPCNRVAARLGERTS